MRKILAPLIVAVVAGVGVGGQALPAYASTAPHAASSGPVPKPITIEVVDSFSRGNVWANLNGMTLYRYDLDTSSKVACTGDCAVTWPPLLHKKGDPALHLPPDYPGTLTLVRLRVAASRSSTTARRCTRTSVTTSPARPTATGRRNLARSFGAGHPVAGLAGGG